MKRGFTLIELMIVIAIVAIIVAIAIGSCSPKEGEKGFVCDVQCRAAKYECTNEQLETVAKQAAHCATLRGVLETSKCTAEATIKHCADNRY
jgi:prepilin-type N-terminal cleavage/methylation domain-containing protein